MRRHPFFSGLVLGTLALILGVLLTPTSPGWAETTVWNFTGGSFTPESGGIGEMTFFNDDNSFGSFTTATIGGVTADVLSFIAASPSQGLQVTHNAPPNGGGSYVNQYTLMLDVMFPAVGVWAGLFQTNTGNSNDGDWFVNPSNGIGISGVYDGTVTAGTWHRLGLVVDSTSVGSSYRKYIDGVEVGIQDVATLDGRWSLDPYFLLLTDEGNETNSGFLGSVLFADEPFSALQMAAWGGATADGIPTEVTPPVLTIVIDRDTGEIKLENNSGSPREIKGYSILSAAGALDETQAIFLADGDPNWIQFTASGATGDISEGHLTTDTLATGASISLGNVWIPYFEDEDDITFEYIQGDSTVTAGLIEFTGNGGVGFEYGDLDFDNDLDLDDWIVFKTHYGTDLTGLSMAEAYHVSDMNQDGQHDILDVLAFRETYDAVHGAGAFAAMIAAVPEPATWSLLGLVGLSLLLRRMFRAVRPEQVRHGFALLLTMLLAFAMPAGLALADPLLSEDFDDLPLGPNVEEWLAGTEVWTNIPPAGWIKDDTGVPGYNNPPDNNGMTEWIGWTFADRDWWIEAAGDQDRSTFTRASGAVMVADCDEWDDDTHPATPPWYNAYISTPSIPVTGMAANSIILSFDSSWRPEYDDNYHQTGTLSVAFDGSAATEILRWESDTASANYKPYATNEAVVIPIDNPAGANSMVLTWGLVDAGNDWWWAVDNVQAMALPTLRVDPVDGDMELVGGATRPFTAYEISSESGSLDPTQWQLGNLDARNFDADGTGTGQAWETVGASEEQLVEAFLLGDTDFLAGSQTYLGAGFDPAQGTQDIQFRFTTVDGVVLTGFVDYGDVVGPALDNADFDNDGDVDGHDFLTWQTGLGMTGATRADGDANGDGTVNDADLAVWQVQFGTGGAAGSMGSAAVPEPAALGLFLLVTVGWLARSLVRKGDCIMNRRCYRGLGIVIALIGFATSASADYTLDRVYHLGDDPFEGGSLGTQMYLGVDSYVTQPSAFPNDEQDLIDYSGTGPTYVDVRTIGGGRPGSTAADYFGAQFDGSTNYISGPRLSAPNNSAAATGYDGDGDAGPLNYSNIVNRGFQLWVYPSAPGAGVQDIVMDTEYLGFGISATGTWTMRYNEDFDSGVAVTTAWHHVMVVRPFGTAGGSWMYLDGEVIAAAPGGYSTNHHPLVLGANSGDNDFAPNPPDAGTEHFFSGVLDELEMFIMGVNGANFDYGTFNAGTDHPLIADALVGIDPADVNMDGSVSGNGTGPAATDDVTAFVEGWLSERLVNGVRVADLLSREQGDLDFNGIVNLHDYAILNAANPALGAAVAAALSGTVPEPCSAAILILLGLTPWLGWRFKNRRP